MTRAALVIPAALALACGAPTPTGPELPDADVRILFVGNSLTAANNLPGLVATIALSAGHSVAVHGFVGPNFSLEEHWRSGVADQIGRLRPDIVVLQQGPSSLRESRSHLLAWTDSFAPVVRAAGGRPALLMVWPESSRSSAFDDVRANYLAAAHRSGGIFLPAGEAWRLLLADEGGPKAEVTTPYGPDGFHPSYEGSVLAAYVVVRAIFGAPVTGLPAMMDPQDGRHPRITLDPGVAALLQRLADETVEAWPTDPSSGG